MDNSYLCNGTNCTITTEGGGGVGQHKGGHFFLFICGDYEDAVLEVGLAKLSHSTLIS